MFWWKSKPKNNVKTTPKLSVNLIEKDGIGVTMLEIDKAVTPREYIHLVLALLTDENIRYACDLFELNGYSNSYEQIQEQLELKQVEQVRRIMKNIQDQSMDDEIVKPSQGISNE